MQWVVHLKKCLNRNVVDNSKQAAEQEVKPHKALIYSVSQTLLLIRLGELREYE